ncbi:hypothetical protein NADFUDRAFT_48153 [Nadsonia fulvescens var. elongata DSM 6958]|uniref:Uncharacterized protein n=1 Tax=Nadsonia fulvescens var. elongata DSM 6958 TaxID=857566 RepID=A0A1E3PCT9_9ASCO|nr:hypothetical protein NADFUDRAFT_48153 [Nadsonia fulvescens var. elongata DSM 6958]
MVVINSSAALECKNTYSYYSSPEPTPLSDTNDSTSESASSDVDCDNTYSYYSSPDESLVNSPHLAPRDPETAMLSQQEIDEIYLERMEEEYAKREGGC